MEQVSFTYSLNEEQKQRKAELVQWLLKNPHISQWRRQYIVEDAYIADHSGRFKDYCDVKAKCEHCAGLAFCRQPMQGQYMDLLVDGILFNQLVPCSYTQKHQKERAHEHAYREMDMPKEYLQVDLAKLNLQDERTDYKGVVMQVIQCVMDEQNQKGLFLWGKPGAGKTWLAAGMSNYYARNKRSVAFVNVPKLMADLKRMFHEPDAMEQRLANIRRVDIVVFDDIGGESITSWSRDDILLPLLDARMNALKKTIFTSNYNMVELKERLCTNGNRQQEPMAAERVMERIRTLSCEVFVKGDSRRK